MKRVAILIVLLPLFLLGCETIAETPGVNSAGELSGTSDVNSEEASGMHEVTFREGVWHDQDWENPEFPIEDDCIPDKETAVDVSLIILKNFQKQKLFTNYVPFSVFYITNEKIWIVSFSEEINNPGACFSIAIRRENAEIVKMWIGE